MCKNSPCPLECGSCIYILQVQLSSRVEVLQRGCICLSHSARERPCAIFNFLTHAELRAISGVDLQLPFVQTYIFS